jgi:pyruvate, orthophosphate dikinase
MDGLPVIIRLIDPPLHEFLPSHDDLVHELADLKVQLQHFTTMREIDGALVELRRKQDHLERVTELREQNPMLGTRGVRLGDPHARAEPHAGAGHLRGRVHGGIRDGVDVHPEVMIPLTPT